MTVTGFDLDMTLIDSRPGVKATWEQLAAETGATIDTDLVVSRLGPPLETEMAHWFPADEIAVRSARYKAIYPDVAIDLIEAMPGAHAAIEAANRTGRTFVLTAKHTANAQLHVDRLGLGVAEVFGNAWREAKGLVLREQAATTYVGDHEHDMIAAGVAGIPGVGVLTGPSTADELRAAGAAAVLGSLEELPGWLAQHA